MLENLDQQATVLRNTILTRIPANQFETNTREQFIGELRGVEALARITANAIEDLERVNQNEPSSSIQPE